MAVLTAATKTCMLLVEKPGPSVSRTELSGDGAVYEISFSVSSSAAIIEARTELLGHVQNHLRHAGISLAVAGLAQVPRTKVPGPEELLEESDWFGVLAPEDRALLAANMTEVFVTDGADLIRQNEEPEAMFIIASGAVEFSRSDLPERRAVYRMGPGGSVGAIALITGSPYAVTGTARTAVKAYRLDKEAIKSAINLRPELVLNLEALASRGRGRQHNDVAAPESDRIDSSNLFLVTLRSFLQKLSTAASHKTGGGSPMP
jgi:CRP-like cAMP-binding protein